MTSYFTVDIEFKLVVLMVALTAYERVDIELNSGYIGVFSGIPTCQENTLCIRDANNKSYRWGRG